MILIFWSLEISSLFIRVLFIQIVLFPHTFFVCNFSKAFLTDVSDKILHIGVIFLRTVFVYKRVPQGSSLPGSLVC